MSRGAVDALTSQVNASSDAALKVIRARLPAIEGASRRADGSIDVAAFRSAVLAEAEPVLAAATDASAAAAAQLYDLIRTEVLGEPLGAAPDSGRDPAATEEAVRYFAQSVVDTGGTGEFARRLGERVDYEVKRAAGHATMANAARDPARPRWARVPSGRETCEFCIMLASRGFVYDSDSKDFHTHPGCDCRIVPQFSGGQRVRGYDPALYFDRYLENEKAKTSRPAAAARAFSSVGAAQAHVDGASDMDDLQRRVEEAMAGVASMFPSAVSAKKFQGVVAVTARRRMRELQGLPVGTIEYEKPRSSFVGTRDERDLAAHDALAVAGRHVVVAAEDAPDGRPNIDILLDGVTTEIKSPDGSNIRAVESNVRKAKAQFNKEGEGGASLVFNGMYFGLGDDVVGQELERRARMHGIERVVHILRDGDVRDVLP